MMTTEDGLRFYFDGWYVHRRDAQSVAEMLTTDQWAAVAVVVRSVGSKKGHAVFGVIYVASSPMTHNHTASSWAPHLISRGS